MVKGLSNLVPWCSGGPLGAGRWGRVGSVGGTGSWAPHTARSDLLLSPELQSVHFARGDHTTVRPNKNFLNVYCASGPEWGAGGSLRGGQGAYKTARVWELEE